MWPPVCEEAPVLLPTPTLSRAAGSEYQGLCTTEATTPLHSSIAGQPLDSESLTTQVSYRAGDRLPEKIELSLFAGETVRLRAVLRYGKQTGAED